MAGNTIKTRVQLKNDTEEHWNSAVLTSDSTLGTKQSGTSFVPLKGEAIIYSTDGTHPFSRLKMGDGITNVADLPFISAAHADNANNATTVNNYTVGTNVPSNAVFTDTTVELIDISEASSGGD